MRFSHLCILDRGSNIPCKVHFRKGPIHSLCNHFTRSASLQNLIYCSYHGVHNRHNLVIQNYVMVEDKFSTVSSNSVIQYAKSITITPRTKKRKWSRFMSFFFIIIIYCTLHKSMNIDIESVLYYNVVFCMTDSQQRRRTN
jgi:hypothetical protein